MTFESLLLIIVIVLLVSALPFWPHSRQWGYAPTGTVGLILVIFLFWIFLGDKNTTHVGDNIQAGMDDAAHDVKKLGREVKDSVRDMTK